MKKIVLCIMDGIGFRKESYGNAVKNAKTPNLDKLMKKYPHSLLEASGISVGLPEKQMGNSEVGHTNIGAGRVVYQPLMHITNDIENETFYKNEEILSAINYAKNNNSKLHILGLLSDGGVHSHIAHLFALLEMCKKNNISNVYLHLFLDGRDTLKNSACTYLKQLEDKIQELNIGTIATISGRYYAMDRDNNWCRIKLAYESMVLGKNEINNIYEYINNSYKNNIFDEFIIPCIVNNNGLIEDNDALITFNFRPDRLRELFTAITNQEFNEFSCKRLNNIKLVTMFPVAETVKCTNAYKIQNINNGLGEYLSIKGYSQLRIAETEKYAHVTYFFDGGVDKTYKNEKRILIPSPKVATYDLKPEMSAYEITKHLLKEIPLFDITIVNYANGDMVGHTGNYDATIKAVEVVDDCIGKLYQKAEEIEGTLIITADHGNSDYMIDENNNPVTSHSTSLVPLIITDDNYLLENGKLSDIAPTILKLLYEEIPKEMNGKVLIKEKV